MISDEKILTIFPNIIFTKGFNRGTAIDLLYGTIKLIPNDLIDFVNCLKKKELKIVKEEDTIYNSYVYFLISNEFAEFLDEKISNCLVPLNEENFPNSTIIDSIIEVDTNSKYDFEKLINQLQSCGVKFLEIRFLDFESFYEKFDLLKSFTIDSIIESIVVLIPFHRNLEKSLKDKLDFFLRLEKIIIYNCPTGFSIDGIKKPIYFTSQESIEKEHCGNISPNDFVISTSNYTFNKNFNNCLAYKVSINKHGEVMNCPSMTCSYGNIHHVKLTEVISQDEFKKHWNITKDEVLVCSECEFRFVCKDCRAFTTSNVNHRGKPLKCGYNPYISLWDFEKGFLPEFETGITFFEDELHLDIEKIKQVNKRLWE